MTEAEKITRASKSNLALAFAAFRPRKVQPNQMHAASSRGDAASHFSSSACVLMAQRTLDCGGKRQRDTAFGRDFRRASATGRKEQCRRNAPSEGGVALRFPPHSKVAPHAHRTA